MKNIIIILMVIPVFLSCSKKTLDKSVDDKHLFAKALEQRNSKKIHYYSMSIRMTENMQNIIKLNNSLEDDSLIKLNNQINYIEQFTAQMSDIHRLMLNKLAKWIYLKQIYQHEISPPVRILQRNELYLTPSNIDFERCPNETPSCATEIRKKAQVLMTNDEIKVILKSMAAKDPCVNLTTQLKGHSFANSCLKKNKGQLRIQLLSLPYINKGLWIQALSLE